MTNPQPRPDDAVLGGQTKAPIDAVVLGGIEGVRQKLGSDNEALKREGVMQAPNYGEKGIDALFGVLEKGKNLNIQWLAYQTLQKQGNPIIEVRLKKYFPWSWYEYESVTVNRRGEIIQRTPGRARYYREDLGNGIYLDMVYIAGGTFLMGAPESEFKSTSCERPRHRVTVPDYWLGKYQVTQGQWEVVMGENPARFKRVNQPVELVSWDRCQEFCRKLSELAGRGYRLPSEAEWEYACRGGTTKPFSSVETITSNLDNYNGNYTYREEEKGKYRKETVEVGSFPPNPRGLYDMHGNVWEWCEDAWHDNYEGAPTDGSAWTDDHSSSSLRVLRGGSWKDLYSDYCRSAFRSGRHRYRVNDNFGLRLVLSASRT